MKTIFTYYNFPEKWAELSPRFAFADSEINLSLQFFTELDVARANVVDSDCTPQQVQSFMVKVAVALSYATVMAARLGGHLNQANERLDNVTAAKTASLTASAKSDAQLGRMLTIDPEVSKARYDVKDLEVMLSYAGNIFRTLQKDAENWRARYYGAHSDRKLTPGVNAPESEDAGWSGGVPPSLSGGGH